MGSLSLLLLYTVLITFCGFAFCSLYYCGRCLENSASMNKEIVDKLSEAANKLDESQDSGHQKESMPKPHQVLVPGKKDSAGQV